MCPPTEGKLYGTGCLQLNSHATCQRGSIPGGARQQFSAHIGGMCVISNPTSSSARVLSSAQPEIWWETLSPERHITYGRRQRASRAAQGLTLGVSYSDAFHSDVVAFLCFTRLDQLPLD